MPNADASAWPLVVAPPAWRCVDFISDLHLQAAEPLTFEAWASYLRSTSAQAVFILGDLFEAWVGDDLLGSAGSAFEDRCAGLLSETSARIDLFFMRGNRDFLIGEAFARACGLRLLEDPAVLDFAGQRWLLSHGDALCLADADYQRFRTQVRDPAWQEAFLRQPLAQRLQLARDMRSRSEAHKRAHPTFADADAQASTAWLRAAGASTLIHGHTHQPADHRIDGQLQRRVLSDWDLAAQPPRFEVLRIEGGAAPARVRRLAPNAA